MRERNAQRYLYAMRPVGKLGPVKLGVSIQPESRLMRLTTWSPVPLELIFRVPGSHRLERDLHSVLQGSLSHQEWFFPTTEVQDFVEYVLAGNTPEDWLPDEIPQHPDISARSQRAKQAWENRAKVSTKAKGRAA